MKIFIDGSKRAAVSRMFPIWIKEGHSIEDNPKNADIQLSVVKIKNKGLPTVLRLDGVYYDLDEDYNKKNSDISRSHKIADAIIYQSYFSKSMCENYLSPKTTTIFDVVYNGISDWNNPIPHDNINVVACAKWRRPKRLPEIITIFQEFRKLNPSSVLHIYGPMGKGAYEIKAPHVIYHGTVDENKLKEAYKTADIFLHICKRDTCPSSVIEAISAGIPVITTNVCGGATEICLMTEGCGVLFEEEEKINPNYIYRDPYNNIPNFVIRAIVEYMNEIIIHKIKSKLPKELTIEYVAKKYLEVMEKIK